jgi:PAS domain S-box-containing protein
MASELNSRLLSFYRAVSRAAGGIVLAVGLLALAGWLLDIPTLTSLLPGMATMKANTALGFILSGISLWSLNHGQTKNPIRLLPTGCAGIVLLIAVLTLGEYALNRDLGIDQLLFKDELTPQNIHPGRMSPATALNLFLVGLALLLLSVNQFSRLKESCTILALIISLVVLIGYAYGVPSLYQFFPFSSVALPTALTFAILCLGILFARPELGMMKIFSSDKLGGGMARRLTPAAVVIPILMGWLFLNGQRMGWYDSTLRLVLFAMSNVIIFAFLIGWNADLLSRVDVERRQIEDALRNSEERFAIVFRSSPTPIALTRVADGRTLDVNDAFCKLFGYARGEAIGHTSLELGIIDPEAQQKRVQHVKETGMIQNMEIKARNRYGNPLDLLISIETIKLNEEAYALTTIIDITERKRVEDALQKVHDELEIQVQERTAALSQANALLQMLLDHMPDHIYFKDAQSRFIRNSRSQAEALGLSDPAEAVGKSDFDFFPHAQVSYEKEQEIIRSGKPLIDQEERVVWPSGEETWVSSTKVPLFDPQGKIIGTFGISRDITERKQSEVALQKTKLELEAANKELEAFSYSVSHDLRAPLRSVDGFSQARLEDYGAVLPPEARNFLERIRNSAQRMAELIDDLLDLSRVTRAPLKRVSVDLSKLAENTAAELKRNDADRTVRFIIASNLRAEGDPHLLQIVLENLMNNAWKFTSKVKQAEIQFGSKYEDVNVIYFVRDNGAGFDMTYANKLFGAFQRLHSVTEFPGTGVGLATIQRIIHRHGGRIWAEGAVNQGATFFFTLPALERAKPEAVPHEKESLAKRIKEII